MKFYPILEPVIGSKEKQYVNECLDSGWISSGGAFVRRFEEAFARFNKMRYAAATSNGTVSLHLILLALGIKEGDEVIVPNFTYVATANAVRYVNAKPVFVDCEKDTFNIDPSLIEKKITRKTKAIMVTHIYGNPCKMDEIARIAKKHRVHLVEDVAEAHGATYKGKMLGTFGIASSYSFFGNKIITTGEGGMVVTNSKRIFDTISLLRNQGQHPKHRRYYHDCLAYNYRMTNMEAAVGLAQLEQIRTFIAHKHRVHEWYRKGLAPLKKAGKISLQQKTPDSKASWWVTTILVHKGSAIKVAEKLKRLGVDTRPFFYPMNRLPHLKQKGSFPGSDLLAKKGLILPSATNLSKKDVEHISNILIKILRK